MTPSQKPTQKALKSSVASKKKSGAFSKEEHAAMRDRVQEMRGAGEGEDAVLAKIAEMGAEDRAMGNRLHAIVKAAGPSLTPRLWYGMPAYAKDDKVLCFFTPASKFKSRYSTFSFSDKANLDEGNIWPVTYALKELTAVEEAKISSLVKKAAN